MLSPNGVWRALRRHGLSTRRQRLALVAGTAVPPGPERPPAEEERHLEASEPRDLVQLDCFSVGRLSGTKGRVWQYTAIDVASGYTWADLHSTPHNPDARYTSALVARVSSDLRSAGWTLKRVTTDNGSEFRSQLFRQAVATTGAEHRFIHAGRPQSNGCVERVQRTILEECWRRTFARALVPKLTGLKRDLRAYLATTTPTASIPAASPTAASPPTSSSATAKCKSPRYDPYLLTRDDLSADLGVSTG